MTWQRHHPDFRIPKSILQLVDAGLLKDGTTEDSLPNFTTRFPDGSELVLWVDHPHPDKRLFSLFRYSLILTEPRDPTRTILDTNDVHELLVAVRQAFDAKGGPRSMGR